MSRPTELPFLGSFLQQWHQFYGLIGTAAATLVGLMFVAVSIGFRREEKTGMQAFLSPTVVHFTAILVIALLPCVPSQTWESLGGTIFFAGLAGLIYSALIVRRMIRHGFIANIDTIDRVWYALLPFCGYLMTATAGVGLLLRAARSLDLLAAGAMVLLLAGIRNAWDMTIWLIERRQS